MTRPEEQKSNQAAARARAAFDFWRGLPWPAYIIDRGADLYMANQALADIFGYRDIAAAEEALADSDLLPAHFSPDTVDEFYGFLMKNGRVDDWLLRGEALDGREVALEISAAGALRSARGPQLTMKAVFAPLGETRDAEAFLRKARLEAERAEMAKREFLSNISHELRTPLNIVVGMLALAMEDETVGGDLRDNLAVAKDGADRLLGIISDLIALSSLEGGRLVSELAQFSPRLLLDGLTRQFAAQAAAKGVALKNETDRFQDTVLEGGYNFIVLAMEKLVQNAVKFSGDQGGEVVMRAGLEERAGGFWLACAVADNGPGLESDILEAQELFRQGDASMIRKHGGLGLGLKLTQNLLTALGGRLNLANRPGGGADLSFSVPVNLRDSDGAAGAP